MNIYRPMIVWSVVSTIYKTPKQHMNESDFVKNIKHMNKHILHWIITSKEKGR
jgi:hypothetical protein